MYLYSLSMMDIMTSLWQGKKYHQCAHVCCKRARLFTLVSYSDKYLKTRWQTSRRCKTVTQGLCHIQPCRFVGCQGQLQWQGGTGTWKCRSHRGVWKDKGTAQGVLQGREGEEKAPSQEIWVCSLQSATTPAKKCCNSTSSHFLHGFCSFLISIPLWTHLPKGQRGL